MLKEFPKIAAIVMIFVTTCLLVVVFAIFLARKDYESLTKHSLEQAVHTHAAYIESLISALDSNYHVDPLANNDSLRRKILINSIRQIDDSVSIFGNTGLITVAELQNDTILFIVPKGQDQDGEIKIPLGANLATPMQLAFSGESGVKEGIDLNGNRVIAAYQNLRGLNLGVVARLELKEKNAFIHRDLYWIFLVTTCISMFGLLIVLRIVSPSILALKEHNNALSIELARREQLENQLVESARTYQDLVESISEVVFELDLNGVFTYESPAVTKSLGWDPNELLGSNFIKFIHPEDINASLQLFQDRLKDTYYDQDLRVLAKSGDYRWGKVSSTQIFKNNRLVGLRCVYTDITERKEIEQELARSELITSTITSAARDGIVLINSHGLITYWNSAAEQLFGYTANEACGKDVYDLLVPSLLLSQSENGMQIFSANRGGQGIGKTFELEATRKDKSLISIELSLSAADIAGEQVAIGIVPTFRKESRRKNYLKIFKMPLIGLARSYS